MECWHYDVVENKPLLRLQTFETSAAPYFMMFKVPADIIGIHPPSIHQCALMDITHFKPALPAPLDLRCVDY
jgi:hypothetical protein